MQKVRYSTLVLWTVVLSCALTWGCGKDPTMEGKEQLAIQLVKAYKASDDGFSVVSNIQKKADDDGRAGNKWESEKWEAGLPSQKDFMIEKMSHYFNVLRPAGDYWVRFAYKDKDGMHEGMWDVNVYSKKVTPKNDVGQQLSKGA